MYEAQTLSTLHLGAWKKWRSDWNVWKRPSATYKIPRERWRSLSRSGPHQALRAAISIWRNKSRRGMTRVNMPWPVGRTISNLSNSRNSWYVSRTINLMKYTESYSPSRLRGRISARRLPCKIRCLIVCQRAWTKLKRSLRNPMSASLSFWDNRIIAICGAL